MLDHVRTGDSASILVLQGYRSWVDSQAQSGQGFGGVLFEVRPLRSIKGRLWAVCHAGVNYPTRVPSSLRPPAQTEVLRGAITVWEEGPKERVEFTGAVIGIIGRTLN